MNPMQTHGAYSWIEHHSNNSKDASDFYKKVLGWKILPMPMADGSTYTGLSLGENPLGGFSDKLAELPGWLVYITVDDVDHRAQLASQAGAQALGEPFNAPGVGRVAILRDPFDATIAFISYEPAKE